MGKRYLEGLALWQAEDVLPYQKHMARRAEKDGTRPFLGGAGRPWPAEESPSERSRAIHAEERRTSQLHALQTYLRESAPTWPTRRSFVLRRNGNSQNTPDKTGRSTSTLRTNPVSPRP